MIDFGGWELPVQYTSIIDEHQSVRKKAGIFDVSHMGEILVQGPDSLEYLQRLLTNDLSRAEDYHITYSPVCYPDGGVVDDLLVYKFDNCKYLLVVNAANAEKDYKWFMENAKGNVEIKDISSQYAQLAVQGPLAQNILQRLCNTDLDSISFYTFNPQVLFGDMEVLVSRTGYTGEDGFELYVDPDNAVKLWNVILDTGREDGLVPAGLGARDTLRFEAALPLYGHELSKDISPLEAGLGIFVKLNKGDFIGKEALRQQKEQGVTRKLVGFEMVDRGVARNGFEIQVDGTRAGFVTSGSFSPTTKKNLGLALLKKEFCIEGNTIDVIIRDRAVKARIVKKPFYSKKYKK